MTYKMNPNDSLKTRLSYLTEDYEIECSHRGVDYDELAKALMDVYWYGVAEGKKMKNKDN